ncbi:MAG: hypothetical protein IPM16_21430 [Chloroflexi bacterium]|nr:hypothetical protein [Chloroflexota bacterium]
MGFWGWRQAAWIAFISVLVVACSDAGPAATVVVTPSPAPTLIIRQSTPGPPITPRPTVEALISRPADDPDPAVRIENANCSDSSGVGLTCIGVVRVVSDQPVGPVEVAAAVFEGEQVIDTLRVALAPRVLTSGQAAPFHLQLAADVTGPVLFSVAQTRPPSRDTVTLEAETRESQTEDGRYRVDVIVSNRYLADVRSIRAVVSLFDGPRLTAYRVVEFDQLDSRKSLSFTVEVQGSGSVVANMRHALTVDAILNPR